MLIDKEISLDLESLPDSYMKFYLEIMVEYFSLAFGCRDFYSKNAIKTFFQESNNSTIHCFMMSVLKDVEWKSNKESCKSFDNTSRFHDKKWLLNLILTKQGFGLTIGKCLKNSYLPWFSHLKSHFQSHIIMLHNEFCQLIPMFANEKILYNSYSNFYLNITESFSSIFSNFSSVT